VQQGAAWWFNDTKAGMEQQLKAFSELSVLGCFIGMLTDSRSFLSYARHDYFRRILCNMVGKWVENGEYDAESAEKLVQKVSFGNVKEMIG
ncbi:MAG: glucuronate isomerase, partial [Acutalibacteraceae bacterium]|nr:glucuronate isomerase [Acutalibacteraceae bacterium]